MIPNPILKVLSSIRAQWVRALLMGGQACILYGAAEFSRDTDLAILANKANLARLKKALAELQLEVIDVPPFELKHLLKGHAVHFRCSHPDAENLRVDVMAKIPGVASFSMLWKRRTTVGLPGNITCDLLSLPDLVESKKTQRDKDWPMIRRLVEADYFARRGKPNANQVNFWFLELRTPEILFELASSYKKTCQMLLQRRPLLKAAVERNLPALEAGLAAEEAIVRQADKRYWQPLRRELESMRHKKIKC